MKNNPLNVFLLDDEFPVLDNFRIEGIYNGPISTDNMYNLAIEGDWKHLPDLQQLIKDLVTSQACKDGLINIIGFTSPPLALYEIEQGLLPDIIVYDWEYGMSGIGTESKDWLLQILNTTKSFVFVYSKMRDQLPPFLNTKEFSPFSSRFQVFLKGSKSHSIFYSEEFILQYILGCAAKTGKIKIHGVEIEFTSNAYLSKASDILYLERIFGRIYILEEIKKVDFSITTASVEKMLNDSNEFLLYNEEKQIIITADQEDLKNKLQPLKEVSFLDIVKLFSIATLEEVLEKGMVII